MQWQESARKDSERAFGVLVCKFQILLQPIEYWDLDNVKNIIYGCVIMHNMMVERCIERNERKDAGMYGYTHWMHLIRRL